MDITEARSVFSDTERRICAIKRASVIMGYDGMTAAPRRSAAGRAKTLAALSSEVHKLTVDENYREAVRTLLGSPDELQPAERRAAELASADIEKLCSIPQEVFAEHSRLTGEAFAIWREAKDGNDFPLLAPALERVFESAKLVAGYASPEKDPYDYWLGENEEGLSQEVLEPFFSELSQELLPLIKRITPLSEAGSLEGDFPLDKQREFSKLIMRLMGIDSSSCTLAEVEHPYTSVAGVRDVRITTHYYKNKVTANMFSVLHEGGHALYALGIAPELDGTRLAEAASAGLNESQSRFYENCIGRSEAFCRLILPHLAELFPESFKGVSPGELYRALNAAHPSLKRTEADELTYPIHVLIRYELEKRIMHGELPVRDIPAEWNRFYREYLGLDVPDDRAGCLQDMHWPSGLIGYFPTYALGNAYAAKILLAVRKELDIDALVSSGNIPAVTHWLEEHIHKYGRLKTAREILNDCCGRESASGAYVLYLKDKFAGIFE